jgi:uncharacterized membrane protein YdjX (TVP38/TMEM64 family)
MTPRRRMILRLVALAALLGGLYLVGYLTGVTRDLSVDRVKNYLDEAGPWGFVLFLVVFFLGEMVHIPGLVFVGAAILTYGRLWGGVAGYVGAEFSLCLGFLLVRGVGGQPLNEIKSKRMRRILDKLETHPLATVTVLRLIFWMAPALNYALAMSNVRFRHYAIGSAIGLVLPIAGAALFFDWVSQYI